MLEKLRLIVLKWLKLIELLKDIEEAKGDISKIKNIISIDSMAAIDFSMKGNSTIVIISKIDGGRVEIIQNVAIKSAVELKQFMKYISNSFIVKEDNIELDSYPAFSSAFRRDFIPKRPEDPREDNET
jgi:hypothetical protein